MATPKNFYLRKYRKWPITKSHFPETFAFQLSKKSFKFSIKNSKTHLLSNFLTSFSTYQTNPNPKSYHFLLKTLFQTLPPNWQLQVSEILSHIEKVETFNTPVCIFIDLINFYGSFNMFSEAVDIFFNVHKFRCEVSVEILNALLLVLCRNEKGLRIVPEVVMRCGEIGVRIEESSFEVLIRGLCGIGKVDSAIEMLDCMVDEGFVVSREVCSLLLATMCREISCGISERKGVMAVLAGLRGLGFELRREDFRNLIRVLARKGKGKEARGMLKEMMSSGIRPDIVCYNLVIEGLVLEGEFTRADRVFDEMLVLGLVPNVCTYNVYINGLCVQGKVSDAVRMMGSMEDLGCEPDLKTYDTVLRGLCECGERDRAREMVDGMKRKGIVVSSQVYRSYESMISGLNQ